MSENIVGDNLIILDGLYGMISEMTIQIKDNKILQSQLACRILRELKIIINFWKNEEPNKTHLSLYNGNLINNIDEELKKELEKTLK